MLPAERNWQKIDRLKGSAILAFIMGIAVLLGCLLYEPMRAEMRFWVPVGIALFGTIAVWRLFEREAFIRMKMELGISRDEAKLEWKVRNPMTSD